VVLPGAGATVVAGEGPTIRTVSRTLREGKRISVAKKLAPTMTVRMVTTRAEISAESGGGVSPVDRIQLAIDSAMPFKCGSNGP
jgi:hypothetical protein